MVYKIVPFVLLTGIAVIVQGQSAQKKSTLSFEAAVIMQNGDVKPVARQDFYLLDQDFGYLLPLLYGELDIAGTLARTTGEPVASFPGLLCNPKSENARQRRISHDEYPALCSNFQKHIAASTVSDFGGKGTLSAPAGTYYLFSHAIVGVNHIIWSMRMELTDNLSVILDNRNAALGKTVK